jgi:hypothetical protein
MIGPDSDTHRKQLFAGHGRLYCGPSNSFLYDSAPAPASNSVIASAKVTSPLESIIQDKGMQTPPRDQPNAFAPNRGRES